MMGFWSCVGSFVGSCFSAACSAASSFVGGCISGAMKLAGSLGAGILSGVSGALPGLMAALGPVLGPFVGMLMVEWIGKVVAAVAQMLGITKEKENVKELGARLSEAQRHPEWKQREDFESFQEYNDYLKEMIPVLDEEKLRKNGLAYTAIGTGALIREINEETGMELTPETTMLVGRGKITAEELRMMLQVFKEEGMNGSDITNFFLKKMTLAAETGLRDKLIDRYIEMYPETSREELIQRLETIAAAQQSLEKVGALYRPYVPEAARNEEMQGMMRANGVSEEVLENLQRSDGQE